MADQTDGINDAFSSAARVALTAAGLMAERLLRAREQAQRDAQAHSQQQARELRARMDGERAAARASLAPLGREDWWESARVDDLARAWETANAYKDIGADARQTADRMREQLRSRYAIDVENLSADPAAVRQALERQEEERHRAAQERKQARGEDAEATLLMAGAQRADHALAAGAGDGAEERAEALYDSAERRMALAASLEGSADAESIAARVLADTNQARPAQDAVGDAPRHVPTARRSRGADLDRDPSYRDPRDY